MIFIVRIMVYQWTTVCLLFLVTYAWSVKKTLLPTVASLECTLTRYVDDVFVVISNAIEILPFLIELNSFSKPIPFNVETETANYQPFL